MIVEDILHPAPVAFVPARGRVERTGLVACRTPGMVRTARLDDFEPVPLPQNNLGFPEQGMIRDADGLWVPLHRVRGGAVVHEVPRDLFLGYLRSGDGYGGLHDAFRMTPLSAPAVPMHKDLPGRTPYFMREETRGEAIALDGARSVRVDGRARAASGLQAYLDRSIRIVEGCPQGDLVYRRFSPVIALIPLRRDQRIAPTDAISMLAYELNRGSAAGLLCDPAGYGDACSLASEFGVKVDRTPELDDILSTLGGGDWSEDAAASVVSTHVREVASGVAYAGCREDHPSLTRLSVLGERLGVMELFSSIGMAHGDDVRDAVRLLAEALALSAWTSSAHKARPWSLHDALVRLHLPRLQASLDPEDAEALSRLGPAA